MQWIVYWHWLALGFVLIIAESLGASGFLVALGSAAFLTGAMTWLLSLSWEWQLVHFSLWCLVSGYVWWRVFRRERSISASSLNRPLEALLGREATLTRAIENGEGSIRLNDASWLVTGPDMPIGTRVRVTGISGGLLVIEPLPARND